MKIVKVKSSQGSLGRNKDCDKAPDEVAKWLKYLWANESKELPKIELDEADITPFNISETFQKIEQKSKEEFRKGEKVMFIGGDHSISYSTIKGFAETFQNPGIIVFDAHPDCYNPSYNKDEVNTHEDYIMHLVDKGIIKGENVIVVGIRNADPKEYEFMKEKGIRYFTMKDIFGNVQKTCDLIMETAKDFGSLFISIDIDAVDPAFAPGTGCVEPGGLTSREMLYFLQRLKLLKNFKGGDIVEINPEKDVNDMTIKLGSKIIFELA